MDELLADFVAETREMLEASESEIIAWEANPADRARLDTIFRFVHTVKGNCGFFDFPRLASLSHAAEDALADCRAGRRTADEALVSAVLAIIDRIVEMVDAIEAGQDFPADGDEFLIAALEPAEVSLDRIEDKDTTLSALEPATSQPNAVDHDNGLTQNQPEEPQAADSAPKVQRSIRLPVDLMDRVMSGVSDMVLARNDLAHRLRQAGTQPTIDGPFERLTSILSDVRDAITRMRMQRIETLFSGLPRLVRDLSNELGKQVMVDLEGGDVELDREMIETIRDPLTHIIRNAIDHGIETPKARLADGKREIGLLSISARQSGNTISIVVSDDGNGLDEVKIAEKAMKTGLIDAQQREAMTREKILQLIFEPGFSTAETVSNVSGRGVGLDVVRENLERVGGSIQVSSTTGVGAMFTLHVPLTLSIITGLTVETNDQRFAIPQSYIEEVLHASSKALDFTVAGDTSLITFRGQRIPCLFLSEVLDLPTTNGEIETRNLVVLRLASGDQFALVVDAIAHHGDLVIRPLSPAIMRCGLYAGTSLLDDGQPILLLDVTSIAARYDLASNARTRINEAELFGDKDVNRTINRVMIFRDWSDRRCAIKLELVHRIETAPASAIDRTNGTTRAIVDGEILPVIGLTDTPIPSDKVRFLRLNDGTSELLYAAKEIDDAAELTEVLKPFPEDPLFQAITLIDDATALLIDGHRLFTEFGAPPEETGKPTCQLPESEWARTILEPLVTSAGYNIASGDSCDVKIILEELDDDETQNLAEIGSVIRLRDQPNPAPNECTDQSRSIYRYDREGILKALKHANTRAGI